MALLPHEYNVGAPLAGAQNTGAQSVDGRNRVDLQTGAIRAGASLAPTGNKFRTEPMVALRWRKITLTQ